VPNQHGIGKVAEAYMDRIVYGEIDETVAQANARLIAVAPNLLAACKAVLAKSLLKDSFGEMVCLFCGRYPGPEGHDEDCPYPLIAAAIAKTEGKTEENANATHT